MFQTIYISFKKYCLAYYLVVVEQIHFWLLTNKNSNMSYKSWITKLMGESELIGPRYSHSGNKSQIGDGRINTKKCNVNNDPKGIFQHGNWNNILFSSI